MSYGTRIDGNRSIRTFTPDDDDNTIYIPNHTNINWNEIRDLINEKWGSDVDRNKLRFSAEYIQTDCLDHDVCDSNDYTNYFVITREQ